MIATVDDNAEALKEEAADLLFHLMVSLEAKELKLADVSEALREGTYNDLGELTPHDTFNVARASSPVESGAGRG